MMRMNAPYRPTLETSRRMKAVRQRGTKPELAVSEELRARRIRHRLNVSNLPGSPDIANARRRFAIFVHGCFWHRHAGCRYATSPKSNQAFWEAKFEANRRRDRAKMRALRERSFRVLVVWECQTRNGKMGRMLDHFFQRQA